MDVEAGGETEVLEAVRWDLEVSFESREERRRNSQLGRSRAIREVAGWFRCPKLSIREAFSPRLHERWSADESPLLPFCSSTSTKSDGAHCT